MTLPGTHHFLQTAEHLAEIERQREERRRQDIAEQRSDANAPDVRIRAWEKLHGLRLPANSDHPILDVIAISTRLTLAQVQEEQRARTARTAATKRQISDTGDPG